MELWLSGGMLEGVTIEQLRTLRAVAQEGSFSAAARKLGRVQAAISQSIDRLEAQLGLRLFDRSSRVPRLTRHGEAIVAAAARVHDEVEALDALVESLKRGAETELSLVVDTMFPAGALVAFANEFSRQHPSVELLLFTEMLSAVSSFVREKRAALGIAGEDADLSELERRHIIDIRLLPVAAHSHPLARLRGPLEDQALSGAVQIVLSERTREGEADTTDLGVFSPKTWRVVDLATKQALIVGGLGWGHMPEHLVREDVLAGRLVELSLAAHGARTPTRALSLVRRRGAVLGPVARWAEERLAALCREAVAPARGDAAGAAHET
jgi:DNA-binding transcriptional LysR family regulator